MYTLEGAEVLHDCTYFGPVGEGGHQVATELDRCAVLRIQSGQQEEVIVHATLDTGLDALEEAGDEVALVHEPALGWVGEHRLGRIAEVGGHDLLASTVYILVVEPDIRPLLDGILDYRIGEGQRA